MRMERGHMQDVGLADVEVDGVATGDRGGDRGDGEPGDREAAGAPRRRSGRPRRLRIGLAAGLGTVLVVVAVVSVVADRREANRLAALAVVPGILAPLDAPVRESWHVDSSFTGTAKIVAGSLVGSMRSSNGATDLVALNPTTGATVWTTPLSAASTESGTTLTVATCLPSAADADASRRRAATPAVVCLVQVTTIDSSGSSPSMMPAATRLVTFDAQTGEQVSAVQEAPTTTMMDVGSDHVLASVGADDRLEVTRMSSDDGTTRWTFRSPETVPGDDTTGPRVMPDEAGNRLLVFTSTAWWLLSRGGDVERSGTIGPGADRPGSPELLTSRTLVTDSASSSVDTPRVDVLDLASGRTFTADGSPFTSTDDGSLRDLLLLQSAHHLTAYDTAGTALWTVENDASTFPMIIDGQVVVGGSTSLQSIDGRSGKTRWTVPVTLPNPGSIFTDGTLVIAPSVIVDGKTVIAAYGLDDGKLLWTSVVDPELGNFTAVAGRLYAEDGSRLAAFR